MSVGRLAPSPTGAQHLGNARTYLLAWLAARSGGGRVILRIEDIDSPRIKPWATEQAIEDLRWLGLDWDEGPDVGGPAAPYVQSQRTEPYRRALARLVHQNRVYPCTCTRTDIERAASAPHLGQEGPIYPGTCAPWQVGDPLPEDEPFCWRFRCREETLQFDDAVAGRVEMNLAGELGDFPVTRKGGSAAYQLAVVVDDAAMGVTEVVRGDDLLSSTFRQLALYEALSGVASASLTPPRYAHVPLVLGPDGRRLAKRHGDTRLSQYRQRGVSAEQIVGWAAASAGLLDRPRAVRPAELVDEFAWSRLPPAPVTLDHDPFAEFPS